MSYHAVTIGETFLLQKGSSFKKSFLRHFIDGTLEEQGETKEDYKVYEYLSEAQIDSQYGMLSPLLCCLDRCVHHNINVKGYQVKLLSVHCKQL